MQAVIKRLMTDVPFGVLLSGGLDSSLVAAVTARHLAGTQAARQWGAHLHSFCVGLEVRVNSCRKKCSNRIFIQSLIL
jgi:asparagine synthase (glutamine-hydrolysing)